MSTALDAYRQSSVDTATPGQLVVMLYDGVLAAIDKVRAGLDGPEPDLELVHRELTRAQAIVGELMQTLDLKAGPVATNLASLYEYCHHQLVQANLQKKATPTEPVHRIFSDLREAWATITASDMR
jgi:flagellar protein FliS